MRKAIVGAWVLLAVTVCAAQSDKKPEVKPDLSGTWVLDESRSTTGSGENKITDYVLTTVHQEPEIKLSKKYKQGGREVVDEVVYCTNGKPEYSSRTGRFDSWPVTRWRGRKLVRQLTQSPPEGRARSSHFPFTFVSTESWELSSDGTTLTRTNLSNAGIELSFRSKYVFARRL